MITPRRFNTRRVRMYDAAVARAVDYAKGDWDRFVVGLRGEGLRIIPVRKCPLRPMSHHALSPMKMPTYEGHEDCWVIEA